MEVKLLFERVRTVKDTISEMLSGTAFSSLSCTHLLNNQILFWRKTHSSVRDVSTPISGGNVVNMLLSRFNVFKENVKKKTETNAPEVPSRIECQWERK